ncbi:MAG: ABC transporter ATP-binding protein [Sphaerochaeta sp.]
MANKAIEMQDVSFTYKGSETEVLQNINLTVEESKFTVIMGRTGAGKTTLAMLPNGIIPQLVEGKVKGTVIADSKDTSLYRVQTMAKEIGLVLQDPETQIFGRTVEEDTAFGPRNYLIPRKEILERTKVALSKVRLDGYEKRQTSQLSGGEKQRLAIAGILAMNPSIIILDEPTSELDPIGREEIYSTMVSLQKEQHKTVLAVEHSSQEISEKADEVVVLSDARVVWQGNPEMFFRELELVDKYGIKPLPVSKIGWKLYRKGYIKKEEIPLTVNDAYKLIIKLLDGKKLVFEPKGEKRTEAKKLIEVRNLHYKYDKSKEAIRGVDLDVYEGDYLALIGQNGAGKTTLAKHFNSLFKPSEGNIIVCGKDTKNEEPYSLAESIGYVFQNPDNQIFSTSVYKEMEYGLKNLKLDEKEISERIHEVAKMLDLEKVLNEHPFSLGKGERQRIAVASILVLKPKILVVDEPTTGQDWDGIQNMMKLIDQLHENGTTIIMITHDMDVVATHANRAVVMCYGKIVAQGGVREVFKQKAVLESAFVSRPQIAELSEKLGLENMALNSDEVADSVISALEAEK